MLVNILKWLILCTLCGFLIGSASAFFLVSLDWVTVFREHHFELIYFLPISGLLIGSLYYFYGKQISAGNNLIINNINQPTERISFLMTPFIYITTIVTHFFGGSAGREGTALQMAAGISDQFCRPFGLDSENRRILLIASVAAGFGSVFGTPLAGIVFSLEFARVGQIKFDALFPALLCCVVADFTTTTVWGVSHTLYSVGVLPNLTISTFGFTIFSGILFGLCAIVFVVMMQFFSQKFKILIKSEILRPFFGGILVVVLILLIGTRYIGLGVPYIVQSFTTYSAPYDFFMKILFTTITLSCGFKGGEVTPLFFIGATLGSALAWFVPLPIGLLAGLGFVAVFSGCTKTPLACTIMAIELFGAKIGIYAAIACITAFYFSGKYSIYAAQLRSENPYDFLQNKNRKS